MINILHLSPWPLGGATSYVVNLAKTFEVANVKHRIVRLAKRTESKKRPIGGYGVSYQNVSFDDALKGVGSGPYLLASAPTDAAEALQALTLIEKSGGAYVFHDPNEFRIYPHWKDAKRERVVCIRKTGLDSMPNGKFIPHPYVRVLENNYDERLHHAVSIARTSAVKHSDWILSANETLPNKLKVKLMGEVNRFWWKFNVEPKHPNWPYPASAGFARIHGEAVRACVGHTYMVDLTIFDNDGGGTQYSLLEAIDAGAVPVMSTNWCSYKGIAKELGFAVANADELCAFLARAANDSVIRQQTVEYRRSNYHYLATVHNPKKIATAYVSYLGV